jgi:ABC-type bacteriocin/lantibiotic exporter with double-glycine peptidase domain
VSSAVAGRRWLAPEVVQTSAMDCGPATLKSVLEGFGVPVSYGRLREACQTDVDGTSIDTLEVVAQQLGVSAEQVMIPHDHVLLPAAQSLPAIVVVRHASGATHFVVAWRRFGDWLQVMDPATGRRWLRSRQFAQEMFEHQTTVKQADWRAWAASEEFAQPLRQRVLQLGASDAAAQAVVQTAQADTSWFACAALDASVRLVQSVVQAGGLAPGTDACTLLQAVFARAYEQREHNFAVISQAYWSVVPAPGFDDDAESHLLLRGAVLLRLRQADAAAPSLAADKPALSRELQAALQEKQPHPLRTIWGLLRQDGLLGPVALMGAMALAAGALVMQTLLFRGLFDIGWQLGLAHQRLLALLALLAFVVLLLGLEVPIVAESLRYGRHLEVRLRLALLAKLPRLSDRYFQSRSVSDMAERSHSLQLARHMPVLGLNFVQSLTELVLTLIGVALIAPGSAGLALAIAAAAMGVPLLMQALLNERDLRLRNQAAALNGFYLDALLGLVPVRSHRAERNVARQHESLLVQWARASRGMNLLAISSSTLQGTLCMGLAVCLLVDHFVRAGAVGGADLLLLYWTMKLPALGSGVGSLARQYPAQRNVLLRLFEPLTAPEEQLITVAPAAALPTSSAPGIKGMAIDIHRGSVLAAGHEILRDMELHIAAGEQVAIVGASGAGKSSLVGLLLGWHRLAGGTLKVDGAALDSVGQIRLRQHTAWVDPGVQLWNRSLLDNLLFASDEQGLARVGAVIDAAGLRAVLAQLPQGLQTPLGEGGALLSGGEGQRVRLGRAMLQSGVRLALLDEPFRGLDREQRRSLLAAARRWWQGATLLCVTHDVGETLGFSRVLVVDNGRIVEDGVPALLSVQDSRYAAMLRAEQEVQQQMWRTGADEHAAAAAWRHLRIAQGVTVSESVAPP